MLIDSGGIFVGYSHGAACRIRQLRQMPHTEVRSLKSTCRQMRKTYRRKRQRQLSLAPCLRLHIVPTPCLLLVCTCRHEHSRSDPSRAAAALQAREKSRWLSRTHPREKNGRMWNNMRRRGALFKGQKESRDPRIVMSCCHGTRSSTRTSIWSYARHRRCELAVPSTPSNGILR